MKLQGSVSRTTLQIDMQNFWSAKCDLLETKKKWFSPKFEIKGFVISARKCTSCTFVLTFLSSSSYLDGPSISALLSWSSLLHLCWHSQASFPPDQDVLMMHWPLLAVIGTQNKHIIKKGCERFSQKAYKYLKKGWQF